QPDHPGVPPVWRYVRQLPDGHPQMSALILFDFDGTLADTAPDLAAAANRQRTRRGLEPLPYETLRPVASQGARGLLRVALSMLPDHPEYEPTRRQFLEDYAANSTVHSRLFPG